MNAIKRYLASKRYAAKCNLLDKIHREIEPKLEAMREAESDTYAARHGLENSPELYGRKASVPEIYRLVSTGKSADVETDEKDQYLMNAISHNHADESIASPMPSHA